MRKTYKNPSSRQRAREPLGVVLISAKTVFWEIDAQADFLCAGGNLYIPGVAKIIPNLNRLVEASRQGRVFLISSADAHKPDDPELHDWPPHCLQGTPGADLLPEACAPHRLVIPNQEGFTLPEDISAYQQVILQKNTFDVFDNPNMDALLARMDPKAFPAIDANAEFVLFGVATECCVRHTADGLLRCGRRVAIATDAVYSLDQETGRKVLDNLRSRGARLITTEEALALVGVSLTAVV